MAKLLGSVVSAIVFALMLGVSCDTAVVEDAMTPMSPADTISTPTLVADITPTQRAATNGAPIDMRGWWMDAPCRHSRERNMFYDETNLVCDDRLLVMSAEDLGGYAINQIIVIDTSEMPQEIAQLHTITEDGLGIGRIRDLAKDVTMPDGLPRDDAVYLHPFLNPWGHMNDFRYTIDVYEREIVGIVVGYERFVRGHGVAFRYYDYHPLGPTATPLPTPKSTPIRPYATPAPASTPLSFG